MSADYYDLENLNMNDSFEDAVEDALEDTMRCPNCNFDSSAGAVECSNCGIIFAKYKARAKKSDPEKGVDADPGRTMGDRRRKAKSGKRPPLFIAIFFAVLFLLGGVYVYFEYIETRLQANAFKQSMELFCNTEINDPHDQKIEEDEEPFRTGKLFVVSPEREVVVLFRETGPPATMTEPARIHPVWYMIDRKIRASSPEEVDTLVRVGMVVGKAHRYGRLKSKIATTHKIHLDFYDWPNRTYIGKWIFSPGEGSAYMTEEDYDMMVKATSDETISEFLESISVVKKRP